MARQPRLDIANIPQHVVQRGNNRLPCFLDDDDRLQYLQRLEAASLDAACAIHAYALMDNHVHLLVTSSAVGGISHMMQKLGRTYVGWFNSRHRRTGTLWEGRYKASLVDSETYVLRCYRYIDLNPVRARMVDDPVQFRWSSCAAHCEHRDEPLLTEHAAYTVLGRSGLERQAAYRTILDETLPEPALKEIREYLQQQRALGSDSFRAKVKAKTRRFAGVRPAHRPRNPPSDHK